MEGDTRPSEPVAESSPASPAAHRIQQSADLLAAGVAALVAVLAVGLLPEGSVLRVLLVTPMLLFVPGYLVLQAAAPRRAARQPRALPLFVAVGLSPAVVGLAALATAIVPGGFRLEWVVASVTVTCLLLAALAHYRRVHAATAPTRGAKRRRTTRPTPAVSPVESLSQQPRQAR